jgi:hypothetical protein
MPTTDHLPKPLDCQVKNPAKPQPVLPRPAQNENTVTVNFQAEQPAATCAHSSTSVIELSPRPLHLEVETTTDWAIVAIGAAGIISSVVIARYTSKIQNNQIKSNIANLRHRWIEELRDCAACFIERMTYIYNSIDDHKQYLESKESTEAFSAMVSARTKVCLMLDMQHKRNKRIVKVSEEIISCLRKHGNKAQDEEIATRGDEFENLIREALEEAWEDIKHDLLAKRWCSIFYYLGKRRRFKNRIT